MKINTNMNKNTMGQRLWSYKVGLILGFAFGAFVAPLLAILGMISSNLEFLKPLLMGPMLLMGSFIPDTQTGPHSYEVPVYKWILTLGFNGACYAILGVILLSIIIGIRKNEIISND